MERSERAKVILEASEGVLHTTTDLLLWTFYFGLELSVRGKNTRAVYEAMAGAHQDLEKINYETFRNVFYQLKKKGLIKYAKGEFLGPQITAAGRKRLQSLLPYYDKKRIWDGIIYFITYDIPEKQKSDRETVRRFLRKLGAGMLQASVYITPYNPREVLRKYIKEKELLRAVIISEIDGQGGIGEEDLKTLISRVYKLEELTERYEKFNRKYGPLKYREVDPSQVAFAYFSILSRDPQLPWKLLPEKWAGERAYQIFKRLTKQS